MIQDVFIIGATGRVGAALINQIIKKGDIDNNFHVNPTRIMGLASSTHVVYAQKGLSEQQALDFTNKHHDGAKAYYDLNELFELANRKSDESSLAFVDVTSVNEAMTEFHKKVIGSSAHGIVTANKNPVALSDYETFQLLTRNPRRYGYRCSVMAGAEAVPFLRDLRDLSDNLKSIQGCFSGTLSYITSELENKRAFSSIVKEAHSRGYTEPHPRDDLSGIDVARKMVVLVRAAGYNVGITDVAIKPLIPKSYLDEENVQSFLGSLAELDEELSNRIKQAEKYGLTLRYVAKMDIQNGNPKIDVSLAEVPKQSQLGSLVGTSNKIVIFSESYQNGYSIEAPGAGLEVTARNIRRDLLDLLPERKISF